MENLIKLKKTELIETLKTDINNKLVSMLTDIQNGKEKTSELTWKLNPILRLFSEKYDGLTYATQLLKI